MSLKEKIRTAAYKYFIKYIFSNKTGFIIAGGLLYPRVKLVTGKEVTLFIATNEQKKYYMANIKELA